jgi:hypothetical protein
MANLQKRLDVTELDFDAIKSNLITYFKNTEPFKDYDYTGSGLNQLLDVLSYNTHYNAMLAHTAVNESFIDTAQLRSSVISNAKLLGYIPRSKSSPTINVGIEFNKQANADNSLSYVNLDKGSLFKTSYGDDSYVYTTLDDHRLEFNPNTNRYFKNNITLREGSIRTNRFPVTNSFDKTVYSIEDDNIDVSTLIVRVYDHKNSDVFEVYRNFTSLELTNESFLADAPLYFLTENAYGKYEITFSNNNVFGKKPPNLGVVEIEYLTTTGSLSNGANIFTYVGAPPAFTDGSLVTTVPIIDSFGNTVPGKAFGGNERESIDSIRLNAPSAFIAQNRAVTANDYKSLIYSKFPIAKSIAVWGGESNIPVQYGNVFISIQPQAQNVNGEQNRLTLTSDEKQEVLTFLDSKKILSITPVLVDPQRVTLVLDVLFKYNSNLGLLSTNQLQNKVFTVVSEFNRDYLESFEKVFRHSNLLRSIDTCDASILNSLVRVFVSKTFKVEAEQVDTVPEKIVLDFGTSLTVVDDKTIANSDAWLLRGNEVYLGDEASNVQGIRNVFRYTIEAGQISKFKDNNGVEVPPIGTIDLEKGILSIDGLKGDDGQELLSFNIDVIPLSNDIAPKRNQLLSIDVDRLSITGEVDTIATGGSSRSIDYQPFSRER